jgi:uncharacterized protein (UPF0210 family)
MKIRSITYFYDPGWPFDDAAIQAAGEFASNSRIAFESAGYEVQTTRLATLPFPRLLPYLNLDDLIKLAEAIEITGSAFGFQYMSLGPALTQHPESYPLVIDLLKNSRKIFLSGMMTTPLGGISLEAVRACADIIHQTSRITEDGFSNLRFAALAGVPGGAPFFPAAYHDAEHPSFALAMEAADLAVEAAASARTLKQVRIMLIELIEKHASKLALVAKRLAHQSNVNFGGIDFTLAPFPDRESSFAEAMRLLGVPVVGKHGSLAAAAFLTDTLDRASFPRAGFNGLMLPVLEDFILAESAEQGTLSIKDLLLYATVCGTGLDTVPLPGDTTPEEISALLLDLATLSARLEKPLTARLMPLPGKSAGDPTDFDFPFFANSRVLPIQSGGLSGFFAKGSEFSISGYRSKKDV